MSMIKYLDEYLALVDKHKQDLQCGDETVDSFISGLFNTSYRSMIDHLVICEAIKITGLKYESQILSYQKQNCSFHIDPKALSWNMTKSPGVTMDLVKLENDLVSTPSVAQALVTLSTVSLADNIDLVEYTNAKVAFIVEICKAATIAVDDLNTIITTTLEAS